MPSAIQTGHERSSREREAPTWKVTSTLAVCAAFLLAIGGLAFRGLQITNTLLILALLGLSSVAILHARFLLLSRDQYRNANSALKTKEIEFASVFENTLDAILILDGRGNCRDANPSAQQLLRVHRDELVGQSIANFYPDQETFESAWKRLQRLGHDRGQSEIARSDGQRIVVEFTATADFLPDRHLISLRDVTQRYEAEVAREKSLALARSAWKEADALRQATLALTQDLRMNSVLDTLLSVLNTQVPYELAQIFLLETESKLFLAREAVSGIDQAPFPPSPQTIDTSSRPIMQRALINDLGLLITDTNEEKNWRSSAPGTNVRSWLGIRLCSSESVVGLLCAAHSRPDCFTAEHLRLARSLAISATVAIQNARLYERAEIYASQLNRHSSRLH